MDAATGTSPSKSSESSESERVKGKDLFWILISLAVLSSIHPLGIGCGLPLEWRRYARLLPFSSLLDTIHLLKLVFPRSKTLGSLREIRKTSRALIEDIVFSNIDDQAWRSPEVRKLLSWVLPWMLDIRPRTVVNALVILQYVKLFGYHGVPLSFTVGTVFFVAWIGLELAVFLSYGFSLRRPRQHTSATFPSGILREPASKKRFVGFVILNLQLAVLGLGIFTFTHVSISKGFRQSIHIFDPIRYVWTGLKLYNRYSYESWLECIFMFSDVDFTGPGLNRMFGVWWILVITPVRIVSLGMFNVMLICLIPAYISVLVLVIFILYWLISSFTHIVLRTQKARKWTARILTIILLIGVSVGYMHPKVFDSTGTSKDAWTESMP